MFLAGDIGGTRSRFYALEGDNVVFEHIYSSKEHKDFTAIIENFLKLSGLKFSCCVFGIAGVVIDGRCKTTNLPWEVSIHDIQKALGIQDVHLVNDLELLTYGIHGIHPDMIETLQTGEKISGPILLVCPGTGLGVALETKSKMPLEIFPTEAGHVDFAPINRDQMALLNHFLDKLEHVSVERFVSGTGLLNIYQFVCYKAGVTPKYSTTEEITDAALVNQDACAKQTCEMFFDMFASCIGNYALSYIPYQGIYLCGALMRKMHPLMNKTRFLDLFSQKGRFQRLLKKLPVYLIKEQKLAVHGALMFFKNLKEKQNGHR